MADQEFLASFGVEIDETGLLRLQEALTKNRVLADDLAAAFNRAQEAMTSFFESMTEISMPTLDFGSGGIAGEAASSLSIPFSLGMTKANRELNAFFKEAGKNLKLTADASGIVSAGQSALNRLRSLYSSTTLSVRANVQTSSASGGGINLNTILRCFFRVHPFTGCTGSPGRGTLSSAGDGQWLRTLILKASRMVHPKKGAPLMKKCTVHQRDGCTSEAEHQSSIRPREQKCRMPNYQGPQRFRTVIFSWTS